MELANPFKVPSVPGTPLYPLSSERINQQRIPQSPSLPAHLSDIDRKLQQHNHHHHHPSDVQSKVAFLNSLSQSNQNLSPTRSQQQSAAAAQRAILGREEAESALSAAQTQLA